MRRGQVMRSRYILKRDDRGAALIAVIVALVFVMTIGIITMEITTANNRMSVVESSGTVNFYNAETVMDKLKRAMAEMAAGMVQQAYMAAAGDYSDASAVDSGEFQEKFMQKYMGMLEACFKNGSLLQPSTPDSAPLEGYHVGKYTEYEVKTALRKVLVEDESNPDETAAFDEFCTHLKLEDSIDYYFTTDYKEGLFTLRNITVIYEDEADGYETSISTDLVFHTPTVKYEGGVLGSFVDYALIANEMIEVYGSGVNVIGSVYAGTDGIVGSDGDATFTGDNIVTSGDIVVNNGSELTFGGIGSTTHIWAQNVRTEGKGDSSTLTMNGEINVADDLAINGNDSSVTLTGYYNGYNFRDEYENEDASGGVNDAKFNSAIMVNGESCTLDLTGLSHLFLAGRTFISRGGDGSNDIMMGESLSARTDQLACYVRADYLEMDDNGDVVLYDEDGNPGTGNGRYAKFSEEGLKKYKEAIGTIDAEGEIDIESYLAEGNKQLVQYKYRVDGVSYYLNFKSEDAANQFFMDYWNSMIGGLKLDAYRGDYVLKVNLNNSTLFTLGGTLRGEKYEPGIETGEYLLINGNEEPDSWGPDSIYWQRAELLASTYESLKDSFIGEDTGAGLADEGDTDAASPLFASLFNLDKLGELIESSDYERRTGEGKLEIKITNGDVTIEGVGFANEGIVIAKGNVTVSKDFKGIVISGGKITLNSGVAQSVDVVKRILEEYPEVAAIFKGYQPPSGSLRIGDYVTYENWTKNGE